MFSKSKTVNKVTQPIKEYGMGAASTVNEKTNFDKKLKSKKDQPAAGGVASKLWN